MSKTAILFGIILLILGVGAYLVSGMESVTAMIPAFFGLPILLLGVLGARVEKARMHAMHAAVLIALIGFLGGAMMVVRSLPAIFGEDELERPLAAGVSFLLAVVTLAFIILSVKSFIDARRARKAGEPAGDE